MITSSIVIQKKASIIWAVLTDKNQFKQWYFDIPDFALEKGITFHFYEPGGKNKFLHECTILDIIPNKKLVHTWTHPTFSQGVTTVSWLLQENEGLTTVSLHHEGIENLHDAGPEFASENYQTGWDQILSNLKKFVNEKD